MLNSMRHNFCYFYKTFFLHKWTQLTLSAASYVTNL